MLNMKKLTPLLFILILLLSSCEENTVDPIPSDTYTGIFYRTIDGVQQEISTVSLTLKDNTYGGSSSAVHYPAIGVGSYVMKNNTIIFTNESPWFANFDWTYILNDAFTINRENGQFILSKKIGENVVDTYVFKEGAVE